MSSRILICVVLTILSVSICAQKAWASAAIECSIYVDGHEAFTGTEVYSGSQYDAVTYIGYLDFELVKGQLYPANPSAGIDLAGKIEFNVQDFPTMQMQSLCLFPGTSTASIKSHWTIDSADIAKINAYYGPIGIRMKEEAKQHEHAAIASSARSAESVMPLLNTLVIGVPVFVALVLLACAGRFFWGKRAAEVNGASSHRAH